MNVFIALAKDAGSVFHGTSMNAMFAIAESNSFMLSQVAGKEAESRFAKQPFFLSVRRNRIITHNSYWVTIEFKEQLLHSKMKRESVDYWGQTEKGTSVEQEDRYYYPKQILPNVKRLIRAVHFDLRNYDPERSGAKMRALLIDLIRSGIKVYLYKDASAYKNLNIRKTIPVADMEYGGKAVSVFQPGTEQDAEEVAYQQRRKMRAYQSDKNSDVKQLVDFVMQAKPVKTEQNEYLFERFRYQWNGYDLDSGLKNIIHNASHGTPREKKLAARVGTYMRDNNLSVSQLADLIRLKLGGRER